MAIGPGSGRHVETVRLVAAIQFLVEPSQIFEILGEQALDNLGVILPEADRRPIVQATQILFRYTYDRSLREMTSTDVVESVFGEVEHLVRDLPFQMPQDLIYLGRAVSMVSGMTTAINPDINLFETLRPFAQELVARESRQNDWIDRARKELTSAGQILATLPHTSRVH